MAAKMRLWRGVTCVTGGNFNSYVSENGRRGTLQQTKPTASNTAFNAFAVGPLPISKVKRYFEIDVLTMTFTANAIRVGLTNKSRGGSYSSGGAVDDILSWSNDAGIRKANNVQVVAVGTTGTYTAGDKIGVAFDPATGNIWWAKNNTWIAGSNPATPTGGYQSTVPAVNNDRMNSMIPYIELGTYADANNNHTVDFRINLTAAEMVYTPPTGFSAWDTEDLPNPTVYEMKFHDNYSLVNPPPEVVNGAFLNTMPLGEVRGRYLFGGVEYVDGYVDVNNTPAGRIVRLYHKRSGLLLGRMMSDSTTGYFRFNELDPTQTYFLIGHDFTLSYNGVIQDEVKQ